MQKLKTSGLLLCLVFFTHHIFAQTMWNLKNTSTVTFKIKNAGFNVGGSFKGLTALIKFSPDDLDKSSITAGVDTKTIDTGIGSRDKHLKSDDYFSVEKYPQIKMISKRFARSQSGDYIGYFDLTIRSTTKEIKLPFKFTESGGVATFEGSFTINRRDYGVGGNSWVLNDDATITLKIQGSK
jgi:polyisoprenoid-binding protein YceI